MNLAGMAVKSEIAPVPDTDLAVWPLLEAATFAERLARTSSGLVAVASCSVTYVRYRPGEDCIASYALTYTREGETDTVHAQFYVKGYPAESYPAARNALRDQTWNGGGILNQPEAWDEFRAVILEFPDDARLRGLRHLSHVAAFKNQIRQELASAGCLVPAAPDDLGVLEALRYKPESRFVGHLVYGGELTATGVTVRIESPRKVEAQYKRLEVLTEMFAGHELISIPRPLLAWEAEGVLVQEWIDAQSVSGLMRGGSIDTALVTAATALAHFHRLPPDRLPAAEWATQRARLDRWVRVISRICPTHKDLAAAILKRLLSIARRVEPTDTVATHGDFHQGQLLYDEQRIWFLDLEGACAGEREADVGNFTAQLIARELRGRLGSTDDLISEFLEYYHAEGGDALNAQRLKLWTGIGLLNLAAKQCRRLRVGWQDAGAQLLQRAAELLGVS